MGITCVVVEFFIKWISETNNQKYKLSTFTYHYIYMTNFSNPMFHEFYYGLDTTYKREKCRKASSNYYDEDFFSYNDIDIGSYKHSDYPVDSDFNSSESSFRMIRLPNEE